MVYLRSNNYNDYLENNQYTIDNSDKNMEIGIENINVENVEIENNASNKTQTTHGQIPFTILKETSLVAIP